MQPNEATERIRAECSKALQYYRGVVRSLGTDSKEALAAKHEWLVWEDKVDEAMGAGQDKPGQQDGEDAHQSLSVPSDTELDGHRNCLELAEKIFGPEHPATIQARDR